MDIIGWMPEPDDQQLLAEFAAGQSEAAFAALAARYVNLVYSTALRFTGNPSHAEEITQAVFIILARKAGGLRRGTVLSGWLYQTARLTAANFTKGEIRRQRREQEASMQSTTLNEPGPAAWAQIAPLLDEAMGGLGETDRNAVVLRFFENKTAREVAAALKMNEAAAHKRVHRALEKLRKFFHRRGVTSTTDTIAGAISANSVQIAPLALAKTVTAVALAKGATASLSTLTLIKGALKIMAWTKAKTAIVAGAAVLLAAGTTTVVVEKVVQVESLKQRLPDGSVLALAKVSFGDHHEFVHGGKKTSWSWPGHDELVVEFGLTGKRAATNDLVQPKFYRQFRCLIRGETGIEYAEEFVPDNFRKEPDGYYGYVQTGAFPRDSRWLWFRIEQRDDPKRYDAWQTVADFKIANPATPKNLQWTAAPAPATNNINGMDFVLGDVTVRTVPSYTNDIWNHVVSIPTQVFTNGVLLTNWGVMYTSAEDASGNWSYMPPVRAFRSLDPRQVWKLDMDFEPESDFPGESLATVNLPRRGGKITTNVMDLPVTISYDGTWIDASIPTNRPDLALKFVGATDAQGENLLDPSGNWGRFTFRKGDFMARRGGVLTMVDTKPAKITLAIVPNVHTTFYVQPRLIASQ